MRRERSVNKRQTSRQIQPCVRLLAQLSQRRYSSEKISRRLRTQRIRFLQNLPLTGRKTGSQRQDLIIFIVKEMAQKTQSSVLNRLLQARVRQPLNLKQQHPWSGDSIRETFETE